MRVLILITGIFFSISGFSQKKECDCAKYHTGIFYMPPSDSYDLKDTLFIQRTPDKQTETHGKDESVYRVTWLTPCKFIAHDPKNPGTKFGYMDVMMKIIETGEDYYVILAWNKGGKKSRFTVYKYNPE